MRAGQVRAYPELPINWDRSVEFTQRLIGTADLLPAQVHPGHTPCVTIAL